MVARDHSEISIKCSKCGLSGIADTAMGDHPYMKSDEFKIHKLPEGFVETKHSKCGVKQKSCVRTATCHFICDIRQKCVGRRLATNNYYPNIPYITAT